MNLAPAPVTPTPSSTAVARIQTALGDDDTAHDRLVALQEDRGCGVQDGGIRASRANQAQGHAGVRESHVLLNNTVFFFSTQTRILCIMYNTVFVFVMYFVCIMCCWTLI